MEKLAEEPLCTLLKLTGTIFQQRRGHLDTPHKSSISIQETHKHIRVMSSLTKLVVTVLPMEVAAVLIHNQPRITQTRITLGTHKKPRPMMRHNPILVRRFICKRCRMKIGALAVMKSVITLSTSKKCQQPLTLKELDPTTVCPGYLSKSLARYALWMQALVPDSLKGSALYTKCDHCNGSNSEKYGYSSPHDDSDSSVGN